MLDRAPGLLVHDLLAPSILPTLLRRPTAIELLRLRCTRIDPSRARAVRYRQVQARDVTEQEDRDVKDPGVKVPRIRECQAAGSCNVDGNLQRICAHTYVSNHNRVGAFGTILRPRRMLLPENVAAEHHKATPGIMGTYHHLPASRAEESPR